MPSPEDSGSLGESAKEEYDVNSVGVIAAGYRLLWTVSHGSEGTFVRVLMPRLTGLQLSNLRTLSAPSRLAASV